jgi:hypothetical protein
MVNWKKEEKIPTTEAAPQYEPSEVDKMIQQEHQAHTDLITHVTGRHATPAEEAADRTPTVVLPEGKYERAKPTGPIQ